MENYPQEMQEHIEKNPDLCKRMRPREGLLNFGKELRHCRNFTVDKDMLKTVLVPFVLDVLQP